MRPHMDVMMQICYHLDHLLPNWSTSHVKGHQDKHGSIHTLNWEAQLNVRADALANEAKQMRRINSPPQTVYFRSNAVLFINGNMITKNYSKAIQRASTTGYLRQYLEDKYAWRNDICDIIDWFAFKQDLNRLTLTQQLWATKFVHRWLPLLGEQHSQSPDIECPLCKGEET